MSTVKQMIASPKPMFAWWISSDGKEVWSSEVLFLGLLSDGTVGTFSFCSDGYWIEPDCDEKGFLTLSQSAVMDDHITEAADRYRETHKLPATAAAE